MTGSIGHRGPDDEGQLVEGNVGIGMRRLAIVDLTASGHQPLFNETGAVAVVFNGEIYNQRDLRSRLELDGHEFRGTSDTEVLVHGYEQFGATELRGAWRECSRTRCSIGPRRRLFLARDGFGIKPLYLRRTATQLSFASEIRAFAHDGGGALSIDRASRTRSCASATCRRRAARSPASKSWRPGPCRRSTRDWRQRTETFYRLAPAALDDLRPDALLERARAAQRRRAPPPDGRRPEGLFLSGGLDSSALALFAGHHTAPPKSSRLGSLRRTAATRPGPPPRSPAVRAARTSASISARPTSAISIRSSTRWRSRWRTAPCCRSGTCAGARPVTSRSRCPAKGATRCSGGYARYFWGPWSTTWAGPAAARGAVQGMTEPPPVALARHLQRRSAARPRWRPRCSSTRPRATSPGSTSSRGDERRELVGEGPDGAADRYEALFAAADELRPGSRAAACSTSTSRRCCSTTF